MVLPILLLLTNPESCGFIGSKTIPKAEDFLRVIRSHIRETPPLRDALYDPNAQDSDAGFTVRRRSQRHDPSIKPVAPGASLVKSHADWAILDDIVDEQDAKSPAAREATIQWLLQSFLRSMTKGAKIIVTGQRWHEMDAYGYIEQNAKDMGFEVLLAPAFKDGKPLDPIIYSTDDLDAMRTSMGTQLFELQWNQNAAPMTGDFFKWEWFGKYKETPPLAELEIYQGIDLAISKSASAAFTVIATWGYRKSDGRFYLLHIKRGRLSFLEQLKAAETEAEAWQPLKRRCDSVAYQQAFVETTTASKYHIEGHKATADKISEARRMQALAESGKLWVPDPELCEWSREFLKEACAFGTKQKTFMDQIDASVKAIGLIAEAGRPSTGITVNPAFSGRGSLSGFSRIRGSLRGFQR